jgi:hypothetical protein
MRRNNMNEELLTMVEREVLGWDGVFKKRDEDGLGGIGVTGYRFGNPESGGPQLGHIHDNGRADLRFSKEDYDEAISTGRAEPHVFKNTITYEIQTPEDVPRVLELLRINYERLKESAGPQKQ